MWGYGVQIDASLRSVRGSTIMKNLLAIIEHMFYYRD